MRNTATVPQHSRVFVSYASHDRADALALRSLLAGRGCEVWLDVFDINPAGRLRAELVDALHRSDLICVLLSPSSVASTWVRFELDEAIADRQRLLPIILRPCDLPARLDGLVCIDAEDGIDTEHVGLQILRAVLGNDVASGQEIDEAFRRILAEREQVLAGSVAMRDIAEQLRRVRAEPIRKLGIALNPWAIPASQTLEIRFVVEEDNLFTPPVSFFFARFREGAATWPAELAFEQPSRRDFRTGQARVDGKMRWMERVAPLSQAIRAPAFAGDPAQFHLEFDGADWRPEGLNLRRNFELPSLAELTGNRACFQVILHDQVRRASVLIDSEKTDLDIEVTATLPGEARHQHVHLRLFKTGHDALERLLLGSGYLSMRESPVEREVLLGRYPPIRGRPRHGEEERGARERRLRAGAVYDEADLRDAARVALLDAKIFRNRGDVAATDAELSKAIDRISPFVRNGEEPDPDDVELVCEAYFGKAEVMATIRRYDQAQVWGERIIEIRRRQAERRPYDSANHRRLAFMLRLHAEEKLNSGDPADASPLLVEMAGHARQAFAVTRDLRDARELVDILRHAIALAERAAIVGLPIAEWTAEIERLCVDGP
ncbi:toll/interleukin-1 receptor domain-containing protein [Saccharopolyspora elongata]|uniref:Toll/interleukin-1 receptor domain-containing protein n=1 Tax=Saccharopolyspora elongata TaxID=2530387 RepID=A0A4R4Y980_9PSEU|nr:toll/interleukin-1 receptor domain-containing protein [Saccharopolyspora elongata]TDD40269.1 toll/interleukin-1 receptor domain-containing protein [Saccharopolyspora elongata]